MVDNGLNITVVDQLEDKLQLDQIMNQCNRIEIADFLPPHFIPDVADLNEIGKYEKEIEESEGAFEYPGGIVLMISNPKIFDYLRIVYNKLYGDSASKIRYGGTEREIFTINYYDSIGKRREKKATLVELENKNNKRIARFSFIV